MTSKSKNVFLLYICILTFEESESTIKYYN